jgi:hypothetical protein
VVVAVSRSTQGPRDLMCSSNHALYRRGARTPLDDPRGPHRRDGTNDGQPFTDEGVLVRDGESFLLQRRRGVFIAFFQDGVEYDAITPKREQSVPPPWRARRVDREIEEDQDVGERRRPTACRTKRAD